MINAEGACRICSDPAVAELIVLLRDSGHGYKYAYQTLKQQGYSCSRAEVQVHCQHTPRTILTSIGEAEDRGIGVDENYLRDRGIELPEGVKWVAATITERGPEGDPNWVRIKPEEPEEDRVEIRQAQPVVVEGRRPGLTVIVPGKWQTWMISPDAQIGVWRDHKGVFHNIHDERCFDVGHAVAAALAESDGLHGWLDVGDLCDLSAPSRHNPTQIDLHVECLNKTWQRTSEEFARRRWVVGEQGEVVVLDANHTVRLRTKANKEMPYLVGMKRADDPEEEYPVLSVPFLTRARDHGVEWVSAWPDGYRLLNGNLAAFHSPAYGSKALDTARKISSLIHCSVVFGHIHRREHLAHAIHTTKHGTRTLEIWSSGCWARTDGSLPSNKNTFNEYGDRMTSLDVVPGKVGYLGEQMDQGFSVAHVEIGGRERFSVEHVAIWSGWCQFRGQTFEASCDIEGNPLLEQAA